MVCGELQDHPCSVKPVPGRAQPALVLFVKGHVFSGNMGATNQKTERKEVGGRGGVEVEMREKGSVVTHSSCDQGTLEATRTSACPWVTQGCLD